MIGKCLRSQFARTLAKPYFHQLRKLSFPAHTKVTLPALSPTMTEGGLATWKKNEGELVKVGDVLCEIETDKATVDFELQDEGTLAKKLVKEGTSGLKIGTVIGIMVEDKSLVSAFEKTTFADFNSESAATTAPPMPPKPQVAVEEVKPPPQKTAQEKQPQAKAAAPASPSPKLESPQAKAPSTKPGERIFASPLARRLAREMNKSIESIKGTGPNGRILASDVREAPETKAQQDQHQYGVDSSDHSWVMNKLYTPHYYLNVDIDFSEVVTLCETLNKERKEFPITPADFIVRAAALSMKKVPEANAAWGEQGAVRIYDYCDINVSIFTSDGVVRTPLMKSVHTYGLGEIAVKRQQLVENALTGKDLDESPGTFSVVNVGNFGLRSIVPIVRPGQTTSLGVGMLKKVLVPGLTSNTAKVSTVATATLSCDHRVVDGAIGAEWLQAFKHMLDQPMKMLL